MGELQRVLGPELTALIADAEHTPPQEPAQRLEAAYQLVELLRPIETPAAIRAWFLGLNPLLDDTPPAFALATDPDAVLKAARAFAANG